MLVKLQFWSYIYKAMMLHEEIRAARLKAGLTQEALAKAAGIPRNQIARAERGENITIDTLRKIAVRLPINQLTLIDMKTMVVDVLPEPEQMFIEASRTVIQMTYALQTALTHALAAGQAVESLRRSHPLPKREEQEPAGQEPSQPNLMAVLRALESTVTGLLTTHDHIMSGRGASPLIH